MSVHGANRLGSNSLIDLVVFGRAAGLRCAKTVEAGAAMPPLPRDADELALLRGVFLIPILRRAAFHVRRLTGGMDRSFFVRVGVILGGFLIIASALVTVAERDKDGSTWKNGGGFFREFMDWLYWSMTTVMGSGDASQVQTRSATRSAGS